MAPWPDTVLFSNIGDPNRWNGGMSFDFSNDINWIEDKLDPCSSADMRRIASIKRRKMLNG